MRFLFITTGGTIASVRSGSGLLPKLCGNEILEAIPDITANHEITVASPFMVDSTNIQVSHWLCLAKLIEDNYNDYDGFVITHGTDTMHYTAAALSLLIQNNKKPIALTGSQLPIWAENSDATTNLRQAFLYVQNEGSFGTHIVFCAKIISGVCAKKLYSKSFDAFESVNHECDAVFIGDKLQINITRQINTNPTFYNNLELSVINIKLSPNLPVHALEGVINSCKGVLLEGYGLGDIPQGEENQIEPFVQRLVENKVFVVIATQTLYEGTDMTVYSVANEMKQRYSLTEAGLMTSEYALLKMMWALAHSKNPDDCKLLFMKE